MDQLRSHIKVILLFTLLLVIFTNAHGQKIIQDLEHYLQQDELEKLQDILPQAVSLYPNHPTVLYMQGMFCSDGHDAFQYFELIFEKHKESVFVDDSLFRIAQYYYMQKKYELASKYYSFLTRRYPSSTLKDDAQYLFCQCKLAQGKLDSAHIFLQAFIKNAPRSPYVDLAVMDLESSSSWKSNIENKRTLPTSRYLYTIQVGAFSDLENAKRLEKHLKDIGFDIEIVIKSRNNKKFYAVQVEKFETQTLAKNFTRKNSKYLGNHFQIVKRY